MTAFSDEVRDAVVGRAGGRCEYCHLPTRGQVATFPIDHVQRRGSGGETILENLALACPLCNAHKWAHTTGTDPLSGASVRFRHFPAGRSALKSANSNW
ncbi:MAG: HNH endonuclease [Gemmataceae bacterium]